MTILDLAKSVTVAQATLKNIEDANDARDAQNKAALSAMPDGQAKWNTREAMLDAQRVGQAAERNAYRELRKAVKSLQTELEDVLTS